MQKREAVADLRHLAIPDRRRGSRFRRRKELRYRDRDASGEKRRGSLFGRKRMRSTARRSSSAAWEPSVSSIREPRAAGIARWTSERRFRRIFRRTSQRRSGSRAARWDRPGIVRDGLEVPAGVKLLEIDPRKQPGWTGIDERGRGIAQATLNAIAFENARRARAGAFDPWFESRHRHPGTAGVIRDRDIDGRKFWGSRITRGVSGMTIKGRSHGACHFLGETGLRGQCQTKSLAACKRPYA